MLKTTTQTQVWSSIWSLKFAGVDVKFHMKFSESEPFLFSGTDKQYTVIILKSKQGHVLRGWGGGYLHCICQSILALQKQTV